MTLPCIYIFETIMFTKFKCYLTQGTEIHSYNARNRQNHRPQQYRLNLFSLLPMYDGVKLLNKLPNYIKLENIPKQFKSMLKNYLLNSTIYT
jgi:hypothetical protein